MQVDITEIAEQDLLAICRFLGPPAVGERLVSDFEAALRDLRAFPRMGRTGHPFAESAQMRAMFPGDYVMTYEIVDDLVVIRRIVHGARDPDTLTN